MSSSLLKARNVYTGPSIHKLNDEEFEQLVSSNHGDLSYINWEKKYLEREFHSTNEANNLPQKRFTQFAQHMSDDKPLLVLDIDNTLIYVRYFSDEMEIGDMVTFFEDNSCINNSNNARVIGLQETLILQLTNSELIDIYNSEIIEYSLWIYNSNNRNNTNEIFDYIYNNKIYKCKILKILINGCKIEMINNRNNIITIDFTSSNDNLNALEPCLKRNNMKEVDFVYEGFLIRMRPYLEDFIEEMIDSYHIILYTSAVESIYNGIMSRLHSILVDIYGRNDEKDLKLWYNILYRNDCILKYKNSKPYHYKDLSLFGVHLSRLIMIDNSPSVLRGQEPNLLLICDYLGIENINEKEDEELLIISDILNDIKYKYNVDLRYYLCDINYISNINTLQELYNISDEISCINSTKRFINALSNNFNKNQSESPQINREKYRCRSMSKSRRKSSSIYQSIRLSPKPISATHNHLQHLQTISELDLNTNINISVEEICTTYNNKYNNININNGLFGNSNIRCLYNNISLFWYCIFSFSICFHESQSIINIFAIIILSMASIMGLSHNIFVIYYYSLKNLCLEKWIISIVYCFYMCGCLFYFLGGCMITLYYNQQNKSYIGGIFFSQHTFIAAHAAINAIDLYNKSYLNNKKYRIIIYNACFLCLTIIASFSYTITCIYFKNNNIGFILLAIVYFIIQIPIIIYLLIYFKIFSKFENQNNIMLLIVGAYLFCLITLLNSYFILMTQFKQFKGRIYFIGIGTFIMLNGGIIACDMFLDKLIEYGNNNNNNSNTVPSNTSDNSVAIPIYGQTDTLNDYEKEESIENI